MILQFLCYLSSAKGYCIVLNTSETPLEKCKARIPEVTNVVTFAEIMEPSFIVKNSDYVYMFDSHNISAENITKDLKFHVRGGDPYNPSYLTISGVRKTSVVWEGTLIYNPDQTCCFHLLECLVYFTEVPLDFSFDYTVMKTASTALVSIKYMLDKSDYRPCISVMPGVYLDPSSMGVTFSSNIKYTRLQLEGGVALNDEGIDIMPNFRFDNVGVCNFSENYCITTEKTLDDCKTAYPHVTYFRNATFAELKEIPINKIICVYFIEPMAFSVNDIDRSLTFQNLNEKSKTTITGAKEFGVRDNPFYVYSNDLASVWTFEDSYVDIDQLDKIFIFHIYEKASNGNPKITVKFNLDLPLYRPDFQVAEGLKASSKKFPVGFSSTLINSLFEVPGGKILGSGFLDFANCFTSTNVTWRDVHLVLCLIQNCTLAGCKQSFGNVDFDEAVTITQLINKDCVGAIYAIESLSIIPSQICQTSVFQIVNDSTIKITISDASKFSLKETGFGVYGENPTNIWTFISSRIELQTVPGQFEFNYVDTKSDDSFKNTATFILHLELYTPNFIIGQKVTKLEGEKNGIIFQAAESVSPKIAILGAVMNNSQNIDVQTNFDLRERCSIIDIISIVTSELPPPSSLLKTTSNEATSNEATSNEANSNETTSISGGEITGIVIGVIVFVAIIIVIIIIVMKKSQKKSSSDNIAEV